MMTYRTKTMTVAVLAASLLALAACSRSAPEQPLDDNELGLDAPAANAATDVSPTNALDGEPASGADANAAAIEPPPAAPVKPDAQVLDDADATGMTARVTRDEAPAPDQPAPDHAANDQALQR